MFSYLKKRLKETDKDLHSRSESFQDPMIEINMQHKLHCKLIDCGLKKKVKCAGPDCRFCGKSSLLHVVQVLFSHIFEALKDDPTFQMEYIILSHLLAVSEYQEQMKKRVYCVSLYVNKVVASIGVKSTTQYGPKEESFCPAMMLHVLLENSLIDFLDNIREDIDGFI